MYPPPIFLEPVLLRREIAGAFRVLRQGAHIEVEVKFPVEFVEEILRGFP